MIKEQDYSTVSLAAWFDLLPSVIWPMSRTTEVTVVGVIVQTTIIEACVRVCESVCVRGDVLANVPLSLCAVSLLLISVEGLKASNTLSWLGTSDILFTRLPL